MTSDRKETSSLKYNKYQLKIWADDPQCLVNDLPIQLKNILRMTANPDGQFISDSSEQIRRGLNDFVTIAPDVIHGYIYGKYAKEHGLTTMTEFLGEYIPTIVPYQDLSEAERHDYDMFYAGYNPEREDVVDMTFAILGYYPQFRFRDNAVDATLCRVLELSKILMALQILPDITNPEAEKLFGQGWTSERVSSIHKDYLKLINQAQT